jgi:hypothetical protein
MAQPAAPARVCDQDLGPDAFCMSVPAIRRQLSLLGAGEFRILDSTRTENGVTGAAHVQVVTTDESSNRESEFSIKWKVSARGAETPNNNPRKELAAYEVQRLFLDPDEFVVPPSALVCMGYDFHEANVGEARPSFRNLDCIVGLASFWVDNVSADDVYDPARQAADPAYRRHLAQLNLFTYLVDHRDTRHGNLLISTDPDRPRVIAVDNGLAFGGVRNIFPRLKWHRLFVPGLPRDAVERLRQIAPKDLNRLAVVAQFKRVEGGLRETATGAPMSLREGISYDGETLQLGLTGREIRAIQHRIQELLERIDSGEIALF